MTVHISDQVKTECWNFYDSYGEICVHCGCCSSNPRIQAKARLKVLRRELEECENFTDWDEDIDLRRLQESNIQSNIKYFKKEIAKYEKIRRKLFMDRIDEIID